MWFKTQSGGKIKKYFSEGRYDALVFGRRWSEFRVQRCIFSREMSVLTLNGLLMKLSIDTQIFWLLNTNIWSQAVQIVVCGDDFS